MRLYIALLFELAFFGGVTYTLLFLPNSALVALNALIDGVFLVTLLGLVLTIAWLLLLPPEPNDEPMITSNNAFMSISPQVYGLVRQQELKELEQNKAKGV